MTKRKATADPPFDFAQGGLFGDDKKSNCKGKSNGNCKDKSNGNCKDNSNGNCNDNDNENSRFLRCAAE